MTEKKRMWTGNEIDKRIFFMSIMLSVGISFLVVTFDNIIYDNPKNQLTTTAQLLEEAGWEKVCVEWKLEINFFDGDSGEIVRTFIGSTYTSFDECNKDMISVMNVCVISFVNLCTEPKCECTRWTWLPPEEVSHGP